MRIVLDTNVLAPGLLSTTSASAALLDLWRAGQFDLVISEHIVVELSRAFSDPYYAARVDSSRLQSIVSGLRANAVMTPLSVSVTGVATQPKDDLVLSTCLSSGASYLATRDKQLLAIGSYERVSILHPVELLHRLREREHG